MKSFIRSLTLLPIPIFVSIFFVCSNGLAESPKDSEAAGTLGVVRSKPVDGLSVEFEGCFLIPFSVTIPGTEITFEMIPVPGGLLQIGTPDDEPGRNKDEGPQATVKLDPFWIGKTELTWAEYKTYMGLYKIFKDSRKIPATRKVNNANRVDAITAPTPLYMPTHTFEHGEDSRQPAVSMTQYAAKQYTKWISGMTGQQFRLPTEAEWEYAARAGSSTPYSFGSDVSHLGEYACFEENNSNGPEKVGLKKPNPFGLYDMHGNVWEWTVDGYTANGYASLGTGVKSMQEAIQWPTKADSRVVRGGGWQDPADRCRSGARMSSADEDWKGEDPNQPLSPWWYTSDPARSVGMRLVRSAKPLSSDQLQRFWEFDHEDIQNDVEFRIEEGRGALGLPVPELAEEIRKSR